MPPLLAAEPWSWLLDEAPSTTAAASVDGRGSPRLLGDLEGAVPSTALRGARALLPPASFPFFLGTRRVQSFHLPTNPQPESKPQSFLTEIQVGARALALRQEEMVARPSLRATEASGVPALSLAVARWVDWQVRGFQELGHIADETVEFDAMTRSGLVRRSWDAARETWLRSGGDEARMALVVRLSQERALHRALDAISRVPRRVLERYRGEAPIGRIEELDAVCIRDYARRPGRTAFEKAGGRQRLLAVLRRERRDTLENRVACWVMGSAAELARDYCLANAHSAASLKVKVVRNFGRESSVWRAAEPLTEVAPLHEHPHGPNYPLQFEPRYRLVWAATCGFAEKNLCSMMRGPGSGCYGAKPAGSSSPARLAILRRR